MKKSKSLFFRHRTPTYPNFFHSINFSVDKVCDAKNNFCLAIPFRKIGRKKWSEKSEILKKKNFQKKPKNAKFFFQIKFNWGSVSTFPSRYGMYEIWSKKKPKVSVQFLRKIQKHHDIKSDLKKLEPKIKIGLREIGANLFQLLKIIFV